ncbi:MAG: hypothetical protein WBM61_07140 [Woeseiaceae bacterium]
MKTAVSARRIFHALLAMGSACVLISPLAAASAQTICTELIRGPDGSIPLDERESARQVQARIKPGFIAEGDKLAGEGKLAAAAEAYAGVFGGYWYAGFYADARRCLSAGFYQGAADKLRVVASELAEQRRTQGHLLDESHEYDGDIQRGALRLYLASNQYDLFVKHAISYAESELLQRDIDSALVSLVENRLDELERTRQIGTETHNRQYVNDLTPLLDEELAAFDTLAGFEEQLRAHLVPLYPKITDHWLSEEERNFSDAIKTEGMVPKGMMFGRATDALERGIKRLHEHPEEVARLKRRADTRGNTLMTREQYQPAEDYFEIAGNDDLAAKAGRLAETQQYAWAEKVKASVKSDIEKMQKSDEEQATFQDEADEMAREFGFELEE